ncbi:hypothetical protein AAG906_021425 [Vitis piasezkii]
MADALVSIVLERLALVIQQQIQQELRLVVGAENDTQKLTNTLKNIRAVLVDAEKRQVKDEAVKIWLKDLKGLAYDMDNVLDEWSSSILKVQIQELTILSLISLSLIWELENCLKCGAPESIILVTTCKMGVARMIGTTYTHPLEELFKKQCCEVWQLEMFERDLSPALLLSHYDLSSAMKCCFSYCALFPKDHVIKWDNLIKLWMAQSYLSPRSKEMETIGHEYFESLAIALFSRFCKDNDGNIIVTSQGDSTADTSQNLPQGMGKLINLRHLETDSTLKRVFPKGIGRLSSLRTLAEIAVVGDDGDDNSLKVGDLQNLNNLCGHLAISGLGIYHYNDIKFPNWLTTSLSQLTTLKLEGSVKCTHLPSLGKLPQLEGLDIWRMVSFKYVGHEFLGTTTTTTIAFPKLKKLTFAFMEAWKKWKVKEEYHVAIMPCLRSLTVEKCPKLEALAGLLAPDDAAVDFVHLRVSCPKKIPLNSPHISINIDLWVKKSPATTKPTAMAGYCLITTIPEAVLGTNHWRLRPFTAMNNSASPNPPPFVANRCLPQRLLLFNGEALNL